MAHSPRPDVERLRHRLNTVVIAIAGQFLPLVAFYWMRFLPPLRPFDFHVPAPSPWVLLTCAGGLLIPFVLPRSYFMPRAFERGGFYRSLGVRVFKVFATDGDLINRRLRRLDPGYRVVREKRALEEHIEGTILNERWHTSWLLPGHHHGHVRRRDPPVSVGGRHHGVQRGLQLLSRPSPAIGRSAWPPAALGAAERPTRRPVDYESHGAVATSLALRRSRVPRPSG